MKKSLNVVDVQGLTTTTNSNSSNGSKKNENQTNDIVWGIRRENNRKYTIIECVSGEVIDDAQGYGYNSSESAYNFGHNKFHTEPSCHIGYTHIVAESNELF